MKLQAGLGHTLCLVAALTVGFITAKADTPDPIHLDQLPQQDGATSGYTNSITLVSEPVAVTLTALKNDISKAADSKIYAPTSSTNANGETYTLQIAEGYHITGYSFTATYVDADITITPEMGGTAVTVTSEAAATVSVSNIAARSTSFNFQSTGEAVHPAVISDINITYAADSHPLADGTYYITTLSGYGSHFMTSTATQGSYQQYEQGTDAGTFVVAYSSETGNYTIKETTTNKYVAAKADILAGISTTSPYTYTAGGSQGNVDGLELIDDPSAARAHWVMEADGTYFRIHPAAMTKTTIASYTGTNAYYSFYETDTRYNNGVAQFDDALPDYTALTPAYYTDHGIAAKMVQTNANTVGYPKPQSTAYLNLYAACQNTSFPLYTYLNLLKCYEAYLASTDITMPVEGATYTIVSVQTDGKEKYVYRDGASLKVATLEEGSSVPESGYWVAHYGTGGTLFFVSKGSNYHLGIPTGKSYTMPAGYNFAYSPITVTKFPKFDAFPLESSLGCVYLKGTGLDNRANRILIVNYTADSFNSYADNAGVSAGAWTTAVRLSRVGSDVTNYHNTVTLRKAGAHSYASTYLPLAVTLPAGVKAYAATADTDGTLTMEEVANGDDESTATLPATTPVVLWSENATVTGAVTLPFVSAEATPFEGNLFRGTLETGTAVSSAFVLSGDSESAGFYPLAGTEAPVCKAYYVSQNDVKALRLNFQGVTTEVSTLPTDATTAVATVYDLSGRRVTTPQRGIYIKAGRKYIVSH